MERERERKRERERDRQTETDRQTDWGTECVQTLPSKIEPER